MLGKIDLMVQNYVRVRYVSINRLIFFHKIVNMVAFDLTF